MRYRAKCKLCNTIIEAKGNVVDCACGEIGLDDTSPSLRLKAADWDNLIRIDDEGNYVSVKVQEKDGISSSKPDPEGVSKTTLDELFGMLNQMIKNIEDLPPPALASSITHYDLLSALLLLSAILRASCKADS